MNIFENCCRICLSKQDGVTTIYATKEQRYLPSVIYNISGVKLLHKKEPNAKICYRCVRAVVSAESIILKCQESEEYLSQQRLQQLQKGKTKLQTELEFVAEPSQGTEENEEFFPGEDELSSQSTQENESAFGTDAVLMNRKCTQDSEMTFANGTKLMNSQSTQENEATFETNALLMSSQSTQENEAVFAAEAQLMSSQSTQENEATFAFDMKDKSAKTNEIAHFECTLTEDELSQFGIIETPQKHFSGKTENGRNNNSASRKHECQHCSYRTNSRTCLVGHYRNLHDLDESSMYKCSMCTETFSWRRTLFLHMEKVHKTLPKEKRFICTECNKAFFRKHFLDEHIRQLHRGIVKTFKCPKPGCDKSFNRKFILQRHFAWMHTDVKRYFCQECDLHFTCLDKWRYHVESVHQRKHCPTCGVWFRKQIVLDAHIASKKCEKCIYQCPNCSRCFASVRGVKIHLEHSCKNIRVEENEDVVIAELLEC